MSTNPIEAKYDEADAETVRRYIFERDAIRALYDEDSELYNPKYDEDFSLSEFEESEFEESPND